MQSTKIRKVFLVLLIFFSSTPQAFAQIIDLPPLDNIFEIPLQEHYNRTKLISTPFEYHSPDDPPWPFTFTCGVYQTSEAPSDFPIGIFTAYFTPKEEYTIRKAVAMFNDIVGWPVFEWHTNWINDDRVIYKVSHIQNREDVVGEIYSRRMDVKKYANTIVVDWSLKLEEITLTPVLHELGHAIGIIKHAKIDYENDSLLPLEAGSIMADDGGRSVRSENHAWLNDYIFMVRKQVENLLAQPGVKADYWEKENCSDHNVQKRPSTGSR